MKSGSLLLRRVLAYAADCTLLFIVLMPLGWAAQRTLGVAPETTGQIYVAILLNFSIPAWVYFTWADRSVRGATIGKRWIGLHVTAHGGQQISVGRRALGRTAVKLIPWELIHISAFLLAPAPGELESISWIGMSVAYVLVFVYLFAAWRTGGERSVHDMAASTKVRSVPVDDARSFRFRLHQ